jgi:NADH-quinone oxidoreductase subunit G
MAEAKTPRVTIDGRTLEFRPGQTVIQVAQAAGIDVPHYCYHPGLSIAGNCRICMVEVQGNPKPQIACKIPATDGMVVSTRSDLARGAQQGTMELLLVNHPLDCPICDQAGECILQDYAYRVEQGKSRSTTEKTRLPKNVPFGAKVVYDAERCIKCTRCVRFTDEVTKTHELAMGARGDHEIVIMTAKGEFDTPYAMNVIDICPVGALTSRDFRFQSRLWFMDFTPSICTSCARGCNVIVGARSGRFLRMAPRENPDVNRWWMCDPGRLDYRFVNSPTRLLTPRVRDAAGAWRDLAWEDAYDAAVEALRASPSPGGDVLLDGNCSLEEMRLAQALAGRLGGRARFAAATREDGDGFLIVDEKGANARGAAALGVERQTAPAPAAVLVVERDANVPAALRDATGAVVVLATDAVHVPASARVAFPFGSWAERDGLLVNVDGVVQEIRRAAGVGPRDLVPSLDVLEELLLGLDEAYEAVGRAGVVEEVRALPAFAGTTFPPVVERQGVAVELGP